MLELTRIAPLSTVQDGGRRDWRAHGVPESGPLDDWSHGVANVLVGNAPDTAALEIGYGRSELNFEQPVLIALTGARAPIDAGGQALPRWRPILLPAGTRVRIEPAQQGQRIYLAVAGGMRSALVLGSRSAAPGCGLGLEALVRGARLPVVHAHSPLARALAALGGARPRAANWWADAEPLLDLEGEAELRLIAGAHVSLLADPYAPYTHVFRISTDANRMAAPLEGARLAIKDAGALVSEPVVPGTLQLPPAGHPCLLLADAQTIGGYPRIGHLASVDLARIAQRRVGSAVRFEPFGVDAARRLWLWRQQRLARLRIAVDDRLRRAAAAG
jgi:antagonist of KipI